MTIEERTLSLMNLQGGYNTSLCLVIPLLCTILLFKHITGSFHLVMKQSRQSVTGNVYLDVLIAYHQATFSHFPQNQCNEGGVITTASVHSVGQNQHCWRDTGSFTL